MTEPSARRLITDDPRNARTGTDAPPCEIAPDVLMHAQFSNCYAVKTPEGLLLIDTGTLGSAANLHAAVRAWSTAPLHTVIYTHGHIDHVLGLKHFLAAGERPQIIAQENCVARFKRYQLTNGLNARVNQRQFGMEQRWFPSEFDWPTVTFRDRHALKFGRLEVEITATKGETDDHCCIWMPEQRYLFTGDLIIWRSPNCGNPQKVQRYPIEWADALDAMATLDAAYLFPGHGLVIKGRDAIKLVLTETSQYLRGLIEQVLTRLNRGEDAETIFHAVTADPELTTRPYLLEHYDHSKFIVRNLLRLYGGWWNGNAAELMPATPARQAAEIAALAGGVGTLIARGRALLTAGDLELACHTAEWASRASPTDHEAQTLKRDAYAARMAATPNLMMKGIYRAALNDAHDALGEPRLKAERVLAI